MNILLIIKVSSLMLINGHTGSLNHVDYGAYNGILSTYCNLF